MASYEDFLIGKSSSKPLGSKRKNKRRGGGHYDPPPSPTPAAAPRTKPIFNPR